MECGIVLVVTKLDRSLVIYKKGVPVAKFEIGFGRNGFRRKLRAGDGATPEGRYSIIKKNPTSRYYKALLFDYPNDEDRKRFLLSKGKKLIPEDAGIGAFLEIHGGGKWSVTDGCISLNNPDMDAIFELVEEGTPVIIVGALSKDH